MQPERTERKARKMFHIGLRTEQDEPIPVTFYVSPEVFADAESVPADRLADVLHPFLVVAIEQHRRASGEGLER